MKDVVVGMTGGDINGVGIEYALRLMRGRKSIALIQRVKGDKDGRVVSILDREDARELGTWLQVASRGGGK